MPNPYDDLIFMINEAVRLQMGSVYSRVANFERALYQDMMLFGTGVVKITIDEDVKKSHMPDWF